MKKSLGLLLCILFALSSNQVLAQKNKKGEGFLNPPAKTVSTLKAQNTTVASYNCGENVTLRVQYFTMAETDAALVPVQGKERLFVRELAASGERYVSGPYVWWAKGDEASLEDTTSRPAQVYTNCRRVFTR